MPSVVSQIAWGTVRLCNLLVVVRISIPVHSANVATTDRIAVAVSSAVLNDVDLRASLPGISHGVAEGRGLEPESRPSSGRVMKFHSRFKIAVRLLEYP